MSAVLGSEGAGSPGVLAGQTAIVTGAAAGIGRATAQALSAKGVTVIGVDRDVAVKEVTPWAVVADLADTGAPAEVFGAAVEEHGRIDILVNNAGLGRHNPIPKIRDEDLDAMWAVNVRALVLLTREAFRHMAGFNGQVVNVVSTAGLRGEPAESAYCATKFAVRGFTEAAAEEGRVYGVRVHGIYPAGVHTAFWDTATAEGPGVDTADVFLRGEDVAAAITAVLESPEHTHFPELVVRALPDANLSAIGRKLEQFQQ